MRALLFVLAAAACSSRESPKVEPPPAAQVTWQVAWRSSERGSLIDPSGEIVLLQQSRNGAPSTMALDEKTGAERWRGDGWIEEGKGDVSAYYVVEHRSDAIALREIDLATGADRRTLTLPRTSARARAVLADSVILVLDGAVMRAYWLADGQPAWSVDSPREVTSFAESWNGRAIFVGPYAAVNLKTGETVWSVDGCCVAGKVDRDRTVVQLDAEVALVAPDGTIARQWPGKIRTVKGSGGYVVYDVAGATHMFYGVGDATKLLTPFDAAPDSPLAVSSSFVYYYTPAGGLRELAVGPGTTTIVQPDTTDAVRLAPVLSGDRRMYIAEQGWLAIDRWPSRSGRPEPLFPVH